MTEKNINVRLAVSNHKIKEKLEQALSSVPGYRILNSGASVPSDLLIQEVGSNVEKEFQYIHSLKKSGMIREVFLTSSLTDPEVFIQAMRAGAKEFFTQPLNSEEIQSSLLKFKESMNSNEPERRSARQGKIISVSGAKGGVGTTTLAVNLATSLNELDEVSSVVLVDMNRLFGEIPLFLDVQTFFNWGKAVKNIERVDSTFLRSGLARHFSGLYVLPSPSGPERVNGATPGIFEQLIAIMKNEFDFIVIDNGQSIDTVSQKILELSDTVLLVSVLSLPCLTNVREMLETFWKLGCPQTEKIKIIANRYHNKSLISLNEAEESIGRKFFWRLPNDFSTTISAINQGKTLSSISRKAGITSNIRKLALTFVEKEHNNKKGKGYWTRKIKGRFSKSGVGH